MRLVTTIAKRSLLKRPGRTIFAISGIAMGIAIVVAIFTLDHNTILGLSQPGEQEWRADIRVSPAPNHKDPRSDLEEIPGIEGVTAFFQNDVDILNKPVDASTRTKRARLFALEAEQSKLFEFYAVAEGRDLVNGEFAEGVLVGHELALELGLGIGDKLELGRPRRAARKICVDGRMQKVKTDKPLPPRLRSFEIKGILAREKLGRRAGGRVVILDYAAADELFSDVGTQRDFLLKKKQNTDIERLQNSLSKTYSFELNKDVIIGQAADERAFRNGVRFAGLMALGLGLYVIFHVLSIALVERNQEIATLTALGASRGQVARIFFAEALILAVSGSVLGLLLGIEICRFLLSMRITTLGAGRVTYIFEVPWDQVVPLTVLGGSLALLGSVYPLLRMRRSAVARAIRGERSLDAGENSRGFRIFTALLLSLALPYLYFQLVPVVGESRPALMSSLLLGGVFFAVLIGLPWLAPRIMSGLGSFLLASLSRAMPFSSLLVRRNIDEKPLRLAVAVIVIAMVAAAFTALKGMTASLRAETEEWAQQAIDDKVFITGMEGQSLAGLEQAIMSLNEVAAVEPGDIRTYVPFLLTGVKGDRLHGYGPLQDPDLRRRFREERSLVISSRLAEDLSYKPGDAIAIRTGRGIVEEFTVLAVSDAYGFQPYPDERIYAVTDDGWMHREFCLNTTRANRVAVQLTPGTSPSDALARIRSKLKKDIPKSAAWTFYLGEKVRDDALWDITKDFFLFDIIILLTALLGAMGILNGQLLSALERNRELGVLRALGTSRGQMARLVLLESVLIGVMGGVLGITLGLLLTPVVVNALELISSLTLPHRSAGPWIFAAVGGSLLLPLVASIYPILRINRLSVTRAIRQG